MIEGPFGGPFEIGMADGRSFDLGDLAISLLAGNLAGLRDRLACKGYEDAADLVADLVEVTDEYLTHRAGRGGFREIAEPADT